MTWTLLKVLLMYTTISDIWLRPACGASVASVMHRQDLLNKFGTLSPDDIIIVVICGGSAINKYIIDEYRSLLEKDS